MALFDYDRQSPLDIREAGAREEDGVSKRVFSYLTPDYTRRVGQLIMPTSEGPHAAILFIHWYEPEAADSNRTQFIDEATALAKRGAVCLLVETMWSDREWFLKRTQADDYDNSIQAVIEIRRALDILLDQPSVDITRVGVVGHDFGAMYGVVAGAVDPRPNAYILMAGAPRLADWFLYYPSLESEARDSFISTMAELDPVNYVDRLAPLPVLFQFGVDDPHVPGQSAEAFFNAAADPKELRWYEAGHALNDAAREDREAWLIEQLGLDK